MDDGILKQEEASAAEQVINFFIFYFILFLISFLSLYVALISTFLKVMKEKRLAGIRRQMDDLRQQEEALLMPPTPKKLKR